ncbi:MAG: hypothetical protein KKA41_17200 [Proteobacteria bacterium]|nr:hypothetical protein [Patescibacteria group bacterium]MBU4056097.1 hypothetical protein [Pseudomonadota bacterium]
MAKRTCNRKSKKLISPEITKNMGSQNSAAKSSAALSKKSEKGGASEKSCCH